MLMPVNWLLRCTSIGIVLGNQVVRSPAYEYIKTVALKITEARGVGVKSSAFLGGRQVFSIGNV